MLLLEGHDRMLTDAMYYYQGMMSGHFGSLSSGWVEMTDRTPQKEKAQISVERKVLLLEGHNRMLTDAMYYYQGMMPGHSCFLSHWDGWK
jgi:uncharacterized membrane protein YagU involved in acid resistance